MYDVIHCIGNSHASFFSGRNAMQPVWPRPIRNVIPSLKAYPLGAILAYTFCDLDTTLKGRERLLELLKEIPAKSNLLFCLGEIDCRVHLIKQSEKRNEPLIKTVNDCIHRYVSVLSDLQRNGYRVMVWALIPSTTTETVFHPNYPQYGTCLERNHVTRLFNDGLERRARERGIPFISIFDQLVLPDGMTDMRRFVDEVHLSQKAMPLTIDAIQAAAPKLHLRIFRNGLLSALPVAVQRALFAVSCELRTDAFLMYAGIKTNTRTVILTIFGETLPRRIKTLVKKTFGS